MKPWKLKMRADERLRAQLAPLSDRVQSKISFVATLLPEATDWLVVKKQLMLELPPVDRQLFSTRDPETKKHPPFNHFEQQVRCAWLCATGRQLLMPPDKMLEAPDRYDP